MSTTFDGPFNLADYYLFDRLTEGLGDKIAIRFGGLGYTYAQVADRARGVQGALQALEIRAEERVYLVLPDSPAFAWSFFGALAHGAVVAMGNPAAPDDSLRYVLGYSRASVLVTTPGVAARLQDRIKSSPWLRAVLLVPDAATGEDVEREIDVTDERPGEPVALPLASAIAAAWELGPVEGSTTDANDVAIWLFTSGSTGHPKAAVHSHRDFAFNTEVYAKATVAYQRDDVTVSVPRLYFGYATGTNLMFPFAVGATTALFSERPTPETLAGAIAMYRPTVLTNVPTMMGKLLSHDDKCRAAGEPGLDLSCVRFNLSAGEALPPALLERFTARWPCDVYDGIGSAEMFHIYATNRPGDIKPGSLGRVVEGYTIRILAEDADGPGAPALPSGETGVMWVKGDSVAHGYFGDRPRSWQTFHGHWCRTGDLFRVDDEGYLWFSGRADSLLKVSGQWVAPLEVEQCLMSHPSINIAVVIGAEQDGLTRVKAFVVPRESARQDAESPAGRAALTEQIRAHVKAKLSPHKSPRWVVFLDELPRNDRGKIDRKVLEQRESQGENPWE